MPIRYKTNKEIEVMREGGKIHSRILKEVVKKIKPGIKTSDLNSYAEKLINEAGATAAFLGYTPKGVNYPYPASLCVSINEEIVHGIPNIDKNGTEKILKDGDIIAVDLGLKFGGMITDSAVTVPVGKVDYVGIKLIEATKKALYTAIKIVKLGGHIGDIGEAIMKIAEKSGFSIAEDLSGHGIGSTLHEFPFVPNRGLKGDGPKIKEGLVTAIEPMLCEGSGKISLLSDGYTYVTADGKRSAHFEHTIAISKKGTEILTK